MYIFIISIYYLHGRHFVFKSGWDTSFKLNYIARHPFFLVHTDGAFPLQREARFKRAVTSAARLWLRFHLALYRPAGPNSQFFWPHKIVVLGPETTRLSRAEYAKLERASLARGLQLQQDGHI